MKFDAVRDGITSGVDYNSILTRVEIVVVIVIAAKTHLPVFSRVLKDFEARKGNKKTLWWHVCILCIRVLLYVIL